MISVRSPFGSAQTMSVLASVVSHTDVLVLLEQFSGTAFSVTVLLQSSPRFRVNTLYIWHLRVDLAAYQDCIQWQIDEHVIRLQAEAAVDRWERERFRFEFDDGSD